MSRSKKGAKKTETSIKDQKKPYIRKPFLTGRPFKDDPGLQAMRQAMNTQSRLERK